MVNLAADPIDFTLTSYLGEYKERSCNEPLYLPDNVRNKWQGRLLLTIRISARLKRHRHGDANFFNLQEVATYQLCAAWSIYISFRQESPGSTPMPH